MPKRNPQFILLLVFVLLGLALRLNHLASRSLWIDECFTFFQATGHAELQNFLDSIAEDSPPRIFKVEYFQGLLRNDPRKTPRDVTFGLIGQDTHPPLYFWLMHYWMKVFGDNVAAVRLFSLILGLSGILLAYRLGTYLFNRGVGLFSALFVSISAFAIRYSQEARSYGLVMVLALLSCLFVLRFQRNKKTPDLWCFALVSALGILTHYFYLFISLAQFLYFTVVYKRESRLLDKFYIAFLGSWALLLPWLALVVKRGYNFYLASWPFGHRGFTDKIYNLLNAMASLIVLIDLGRLFVFGIGVVFLLVALRLYKDMRLKYSHSLLFCVLMFLLPLLGLFVIDMVQHGVLLRQKRFLIFAFVGFIPLAGYSLHYLFLKKKVLAFAAAILLLIFAVTTSSAQFGPAPKDISSWINQESRAAKTVVIVLGARSVVAAQAYYLIEDIYLMPVASAGQLDSGLKEISGLVEKVFIVRYFMPTDPLLIDRSFLEIKDEKAGFRLKEERRGHYIRAQEYERCAS